MSMRRFMRNRLCRCRTLLEPRVTPSGTVSLVSRADPAVVVDSAGGASFTQDPDGNPSGLPIAPRITSADGRYTVFTSSAANLVAGQADSNAALDVFVYDRTLNATTLISHAAGLPATTAHGWSKYPTISADGKFVAYVSIAPDLVGGFVDGNAAESESGSDVFLFDRSTGTNTLISHQSGSPVTSGNKSSLAPVISGDGQYVAYNSAALNLVAGYVPNYSDTARSEVYLYDRVAGTSVIVSHAWDSPLSATKAMQSYVSTISNDGQSVVFESWSETLVSPFASQVRGRNVFVFDRPTGVNSLITHPPGSPTTGAVSDGTLPLLTFNSTSSADGRYLAFQCTAINLVSGFVDGNAATKYTPDVYLFDRGTGIATLVSHVPGSPTTSGNNSSSMPAISADGRFVLFRSSASDIVNGFTNNGSDNYFLYDRLTGLNTLVTHSAADPLEGANGFPDIASISGDGSTVVFTSRATNLVDGFFDGNSVDPYGGDVFKYDRATNLISLLSHTGLSLTTSGNAASGGAFISQNGQAIAFTSQAGDLVANDHNFRPDVMIYDVANSIIALASRRFGPESTSGGAVSRMILSEANLGSGYPGARQVSNDGRFAVYSSISDNLVPGEVDVNNVADVFVYDRVTNTSQLISRQSGAGNQTGNGASIVPTISADGRFVLFRSFATDLVPGFVDANGVDASDVYLFDRLAGSTTLVSHSTSGNTTGGNAASGDNTYANDTRVFSISANGGYIAYISFATDLVQGFLNGSNNETLNLYLYDRVGQTTTLVSRSVFSATTGGNDHTYEATISDDGNVIAFTSWARTLVSNLGGAGSPNVYLFDRTTGAIQLVSHQSTNLTVAGNHNSFGPKLSANGQFVVFTSVSSDLISNGIDTNPGADIFIFDRSTTNVTLVSHTSTSSVTAANYFSQQPSISADGRYVTYESTSQDLVAGFTDTNGVAQFLDQGNDIYLFDRLTGLNSLVSRSPTSPTTGSNGESIWPIISRDGRTVSWISWATDLISGQIDDNGYSALGNGPGADVFVWNRITGTTALVSRSLADAKRTGDVDSFNPESNYDGSIVYFYSDADNLVPGDDNSASDVYWYSNSAAVQSAKIADGSAQRSVERSITLTFDQQVSFAGDPATAFAITRTSLTGPQGNVGLSASVTTSGGTTTVTLTFSGPLTQFGSLIDGTYKLTALAGQISAAGPLDGNNDGFGGDDYVLNFYRLFGDANGDRKVNGADFILFRQAFNSFDYAFDLDGDGFVSVNDFIKFRNNFGQSI
jgi:hypothetical protein